MFDKFSVPAMWRSNHRGLSVLIHPETGDDPNRQDRCKIIEHIVGKRIESGVEDMDGYKTEVNRVAIRPRSCYSASTDAAASCAEVFNDYRLPKRSSESLGKNSSQCITLSARGSWHDHRDRSRRIRLRPWLARDGRERGSTCC